MHPHALVSHCSESQAKLLLRGPNRRPDNSCGKILNNSGLMEFHQQKGELSIEFRNMARLYSDILLCNEFRRFYPYILLSMKIRNMSRFYLYILFSIEFRNVARFYPYILFSIEFKDTTRFYPYTLLSIEFRDIARFHSYFFGTNWK